MSENRGGRRLTLNRDLINNVCDTAEKEKLTRNELCERFNIHKLTFRRWLKVGEQVITGKLIDDSESAVLSAELTKRLNRIYADHEASLKALLRNPDCLETAQLMRCVNPDFAELDALQ